MASISASSVNFRSSAVLPGRSATVGGRNSLINMVSIPKVGIHFPSLRRKVGCAAKPETVDKVCEIVKKQLALPADSTLTPESKFSDLGADSLDTVEIVMGIEEEFNISVEEESSQSITTVEEAANLIEKLVEKNKA
ncbi:unnamed protein product [Victoria cruziana]